jgi:hypothetical protein
MNPDVPPAWEKVFRCAVCGEKVGSITAGRYRTRKLPFECTTHGELAMPSPEESIRAGWRQHAAGKRITVKLSPIE